MVSSSRLTQAQKSKMIIRAILEGQGRPGFPTFFEDILRRRGVDISGFTALRDLLDKDRLRRVDLYSLFYPYNATEYGKAMYNFTVGLRGKSNRKASIRNLFSQLVCRAGFMSESPGVCYDDREFFLI